MGRLRKDHSGWKTMGLWKKYQYPKIEEAPLLGKNHKDTRKWCKGRKGIKHEFELIEKSKFLEWTWIISKCKTCGKQQYRSLRKTPN